MGVQNKVQSILLIYNVMSAYLFLRTSETVLPDKMFPYLNNMSCTPKRDLKIYRINVKANFYLLLCLEIQGLVSRYLVYIPNNVDTHQMIFSFCAHQGL